MNVKKATLSVAIAAALGLSVNVSQAAIIDMDYSGLFTILDPAGVALYNTSNPYYHDSSWDHGLRTQISGTMSINTRTGAGVATLSPFNFFNGGEMVYSGMELQAIGGGLLLANMDYAWYVNDTNVQIVLDASGLISALATGLPSVGSVMDQNYCATTGSCTLPASDGIKRGGFPIGAVPIATSSYNVNGATGISTTLAQLSLGADDGIGGSPMDSGPFSNYSINLDLTSLTFTAVSSVPVPAAVWLFASGLVGLAGVARRRKSS